MKKVKIGKGRKGKIELKTVPDTNGGCIRGCLANPYQRILSFSPKTMFCVLKLHKVLLKEPPFVPDTSYPIKALNKGKKN